MSTDHDGTRETREALRAAERAALAPWVVYARSPWWLAPFIGVYAALLTLNIGLVEGPLGSISLLVLVAAAIGVVNVRARRAGAWPSGKAPEGLARPQWLLFAGTAAVGLLTWGTAQLSTIWLAAAVAAIGGAALSLTYDAAYTRAARRAQERLA